MSVLLEINNLSISFGDSNKQKKVLNNVSFHLSKNEILGVVGESGSGKSLTSLAIMGLLPENCDIDGEIIYNSNNLLEIKESVFQKIRGASIAMVFQEPMSALNPSMRCGKQVAEVLLNHNKLKTTEARSQVLELFEKVKLPNPKRIYKAYPHELSGGQKQRVVIAMAIACKPKILIADEPTTALDVTVQKEIIELLAEIQSNSGMSVIFISHDLSLVASIASRVAVMYRGEMVEIGSTKTIFNSPEHLYTKALIASKPDLNIRLKKLPTVEDVLSKNIEKNIISKEERDVKQQKIYNQKPLLEVNSLSKYYTIRKGVFSSRQLYTAVNQVSFKLYPGETLGLVGESGCGKSTLSNAILMLDPPSKGEILFEQKCITSFDKKALKKLRKDIQIIFQDPFASLNPRISVGKAILEPMTVHNIGNDVKDRTAKVKALLLQVGLKQEDFYKYPHEFSGGQRQRVGIARAIAVHPKLIICDESVSALDISVQAQVLNLLNNLKADFGFSYIFISHDLTVVKYMSDQLMVMEKGEIVEKGDADQIYNSPKNSYTKTLIEAVPKTF
ncbi:MAG: ABC transporter ATP-binding protein [Flavobacteriaceae bacterium]